MLDRELASSVKLNFARGVAEGGMCAGGRGGVVSVEKCAEIALDSADNVAQMVIQKAQLIPDQNEVL